MNILILLVIDNSLTDKNDIITNFKKALVNSNKNYVYKILNIDEENINKALNDYEKQYEIKFIISLLYNSKKDLQTLRKLKNEYIKYFRVSSSSSYLEDFAFKHHKRNLITKNYYTTPYFSNHTHIVVPDENEENNEDRRYCFNEIYGILHKSFVKSIHPEDIEQAREDKGIIFLNYPSYVTIKNFKNLNKLFLGECALSSFNNIDFNNYEFNYNLDNKNLTITNLEGTSITCYTHSFALLNAGAYPEDLTSPEINNKIKFNKCTSSGYKLNLNL